MRLSKWRMQLSRARRLSSERTMYQGANLVLVAANIMSRAREYSNHLLREHKSVGLSFHWRSGSSIRAKNRRLCSASPTSSQYLISCTPPSTMNSSNSGQTLRKWRCSSSVQNSMTCSTPARLYQLRSKIDLACGRQMRDVALQIQLPLLSIRRRRQRHRPKDAGTDPLGDGFDRPALAGSIAAFEDHDHPQTLMLDPILQRAKLHLELAQRFLV